MKGKAFKEPIFNGVVEGQITQFREIINPQPGLMPKSWSEFPLSIHQYYNDFEDKWYYSGENGTEFIKPRYKVGEVLYLKEPYMLAIAASPNRDDDNVFYKYSIFGSFQKRGWIKAMPAKYARYFIEITTVRCERLHDISDEDCVSEGICPIWNLSRTFIIGCSNKSDVVIYNSIKEAYAALINKINGKGTFDKNPYVWVYDFKLVNND